MLPEGQKGQFGRVATPAAGASACQAGESFGTFSRRKLFGLGPLRAEIATDFRAALKTASHTLPEDALVPVGAVHEPLASSKRSHPQPTAEQLFAGRAEAQTGRGQPRHPQIYLRADPRKAFRTPPSRALRR